MPPKRASEDIYFKLPSDLGAFGVLSVFVEEDRLKGIIEVLMFFTLAERASDALVGVVTALGRSDVPFAFDGDVILPSLDIGRAVLASSLYPCLTRFSGETAEDLP